MNISRRRISANGLDAKALVIDGITNEENILAFVLCCMDNDPTSGRPFYVICKDGIGSIYTFYNEYFNEGYTTTTNYTLKDGVLTLNGLGIRFPAVLLTIYKLI